MFAAVYTVPGTQVDMFEVLVWLAVIALVVWIVLAVRR